MSLYHIFFFLSKNGTFNVLLGKISVILTFLLDFEFNNQFYQLFDLKTIYKLTTINLNLIITQLSSIL